MKAPDKIMLESRHWWEEGNTIGEMDEGNVICFSFGDRRLRRIPYKIKWVEKDKENGKIHTIMLERYRPGQ